MRRSNPWKYLWSHELLHTSTNQKTWKPCSFFLDIWNGWHHGILHLLFYGWSLLWAYFPLQGTLRRTNKIRRKNPFFSLGYSFSVGIEAGPIPWKAKISFFEYWDSFSRDVIPSCSRARRAGADNSFRKLPVVFSLFANWTHQAVAVFIKFVSVFAGSHSSFWWCQNFAMDEFLLHSTKSIISWNPISS